MASHLNGDGSDDWTFNPVCLSQGAFQDLARWRHALATGRPGQALGAADQPSPPSTRSASRVVITSGRDRADLIFQGLDHMRTEIARAIGDRLVVIKPNNVAIDCHSPPRRPGVSKVSSSSSSRSASSGTRSSPNRPAMGPTPEGFANYGYAAGPASMG